MITITFNTSVVKTGKGRYIAHAQEFPVTSESATTQRGAIKKLKVAVQSRLRHAAQRGTLTNSLDDAGYAAELLGLDNKITLRANIHDNATVSMPLSSQLLTLDRGNWRRRR